MLIKLLQLFVSKPFVGFRRVFVCVRDTVI
jgi:hypothetical protein